MENTQQNWSMPDWIKVMATIEQSEHDYRPDFINWLRKNYPIWSAFVAKTKEAKVYQDRARFSARFIIESVRWDTMKREAATQTVDGEIKPLFKVNNNYVADLSRLIMDLHEPLRGFYQIRSNPTRESGIFK